LSRVPGRTRGALGSGFGAGEEAAESIAVAGAPAPLIVTQLWAAPLQDAWLPASEIVGDEAGEAGADTGRTDASVVSTEPQ
jgi:hypothetical protein